MLRTRASYNTEQFFIRMWIKGWSVPGKNTKRISKCYYDIWPRLLPVNILYLHIPNSEYSKGLLANRQICLPFQKKPSFNFKRRLFHFLYKTWKWTFFSFAKGSHLISGMINAILWINERTVVGKLNPECMCHPIHYDKLSLAVYMLLNKGFRCWTKLLLE